ncbi:MAG: hypothetical protein FD143_3299 [Ignavibacteria bacterium]|nr:MAG: hypothetical protein FD143_3299 [Ignavibacteria bacterium]
MSQHKVVLLVRLVLVASSPTRPVEFDSFHSSTLCHCCPRGHPAGHLPPGHLCPHYYNQEETRLCLRTPTALSFSLRFSLCAHFVLTRFSLSAHLCALLGAPLCALLGAPLCALLGAPLSALLCAPSAPGAP